jgi:redox-sensitive bicupin YhaK (pirin superfamily)
MSGPVELADVAASEQASMGDEVVVTDSRLAQVGSMQVRRALPTRGRRTVGAWCFADHFGPVQVDGCIRADIGPHPHLGLQTVTWLLAGELIHRDSLGSEQPIRPGQLNLMTAGHGVAHAEEAPEGYRGTIHGIQLWVAQPSATREGPAAFEHHADLPQGEYDNGTATLLIGTIDGMVSPARRDTDHSGVDLALRPGDTTIPTAASFEHAVIVTSGTVTVDGTTARPGRLVYIPPGRDEHHFRASQASRALVLGGLPFNEKLLMWWNFVARNREEIDAAYDDWAARSERFGDVRSALPRIVTSRPMWRKTST